MVRSFSCLEELGTHQWQKSVELKQASLVDHVTTEFPPTYITDGNAYSFQDQGLAFEKKLKQLGVPVTSQFFNHTSSPSHMNINLIIKLKQPKSVISKL